jgi:hypothetical protein
MQTVLLPLQEAVGGAEKKLSQKSGVSHVGRRQRITMLLKVTLVLAARQN